MNTRALFFSALLGLFGCRSAVTPRPSAAPPPPELLQLQGARSEAAALATSLCDTAGARLSGSPGEARGVEWAMQTLTSLGFDNVRREPVQVPHWERGAESAALVQPFAQPLAISALGHSAPTPPEGLEADVVELQTFEALQALTPDSLKGKILFVNIPMRRAPDGAGYGAVARVRRLAGAQGALAGAVAAVIRSVGTDTHRLAHTGAQGFSGSAKIPAAALSIPDAELVHRLLQKGPVRLKLSLSSVEGPPVESFNVVGELRGRTRPEEVVLLGAHLDSWDQGTGALDDGAGVGVVIDALRLLRALPQRPQRTVRVVLFANEENGLAGAKAYALTHAAELAQHVVAMEADSGTGAARAARVLATPEAQRAFLDWGAWFQGLNVPFQEDGAEGGADLIPLRAAGVPLVDVRQDASTYFDYHHTANDTVDKLDPVALTQVARTYASLAWLIAEKDVAFGRLTEGQRERK